MASQGTQNNEPSIAIAQEQDQGVHAEEDLNQVLSAVQREELINLVNATMDAMQETLCYPSEYQISTFPGFFKHGKRQDQGHLFSRQPWQQLQASSSGGMSQVKIELRAIDYFTSWKQSVLGRLGEVIDGNKVPEPQSHTQLEPLESRSFPENSDNSPSSSTPLNELPLGTRLLIINSLLLLLLNLESYNAHSAVFLRKISSDLGISPKIQAESEIKIAHELLKVAKEMSAKKETKARAEQSKILRRWKIGLASVAGAVLVGVTGGMTAPVVVGGLGAIIGTLGLGGTAVGGFLGTVTGSGVALVGIFGAIGAGVSGKMMARYAREVKDFAFIPLKSELTSADGSVPAKPANNRLRVTIGISGWLIEAHDIVDPWRVLGEDSDVFALRWELEALLTLGKTMETLVKSIALTIAAKQVLKTTMFAPLSGPLVLPVIAAKLSHLIYNPFNVVKARAVKAGQILADALINKAQGDRPVTLIGYSMGARVIYTCLLSLAKRRAFGLIESAILLGSPAPSDTVQWRLIRTVVSGRLVNVYSKKDFMLRFFYRTQSMQMNVAGIQPIEGISGLENFDASETVTGHLRYPLLVGSILEKIGFEHLNQDELQIQDHRLRALADQEERLFDQQQQQSQEAEEGRGLTELDAQTRIDQNGPEGVTMSSEEIRNLEEEIARRTEEGLAEIHMHSIQLEDREG
ncbi:hypothetical protein PRK78_002660 [Emydomyces testavorans]|uniref:DUF726-domain-containing protein n=1 Tax=Emydomyces testavorans TaxID=2070801 RepID=A0AAF0DFF7_9EURO|nr:hypothetical protein PRK78_002660 [Emydomyces testavorans]